MDNCVIPHGYKATALGIIPQEWEVMLLGNLSNSISSGIFVLLSLLIPLLWIF